MAYYRRRLPHLQFNEGTYFITFGLAGSLPTHAVDYLRQEKQRIKDSPKEEIDKSQKLYFKKYDHLLDSGSSPLWLGKHKVANIVVNKINELDNERYILLCYTIMPNHVHLLFKLTESRAKARGTFDPASKYPVTHILKLLKGATAFKCNKLLNRSGSFWHHESYDRLVRNHQERDNIVRYILENPVKAGLVSKYDEWNWSYCRNKALPSRSIVPRASAQDQ
ncbi:transposase [Aliifodinibius sp. S!AR15-10]|uniref:transposase n=1 Tax=Aliifodinibius sp. S!AR15-10 TaxID=2950437 RepID=UPI00285E5384|nr:transposase [Aliifodinibius sp. S!AR15-10]MDR8392502.1 transposase [Aliifodinibius sp. S!AR15-10]